MRMKLIAVVLIVTPLLLAQSKAQSSNSRRWSYHKTQAPILPMDLPTKVSGAGMTTPSGVRYWDIQTGEGNAASKGHVVKVFFRAWTAKGQAVDSCISEHNPVVFTLGFGQVIQGWEEGMEGMKIGGKRQLRIPPEMAYGAAGVPPIVPPNSTLIFDVELIGLD
jgi:FKBP-type peptidyl-prolyl cis-trans isomerase